MNRRFNNKHKKRSPQISNDNTERGSLRGVYGHPDTDIGPAYQLKGDQKAFETVIVDSTRQLICVLFSVATNRVLTG